MSLVDVSTVFVVVVVSTVFDVATSRVVMGLVILVVVEVEPV